MKFASKFLAVSALFGAAMITFAGSAAASGCGSLPKVDWWTNTHEEVKGLIETKYEGNWDPYITQWRKYLTRMEVVHARGGTAEVKSRGIELTGPTLQQHIKDIEQRLSVLDCLKSAADSAAANGSDISELSTAAGGETPEPASIPESKKSVEVGASTRQVPGTDAIRENADSGEQVASIVDGDFRLEVTASCEGGQAVFQVTNIGDRWPRLGAIAIYRTDNDGMLSERRLRLKNSQRATFKIREQQTADAGEIGIWIEPSWFERPFRYDAKIACN